MIKRFQPISVFTKEPYKKILAFPKPNNSEVKKRMFELKKLGVTHVSFSGPLQIEKCQILGKGYVGMVILAKQKSSVVALKIRRIDSPRKNMSDEAKFLKIANKVNAGPKLIKYSKNFLVMEYIKGKKIVDWINNSNEKDSKILTSIIRKILLNCFSLDQIGLDHGELSVLDKHILITNKTPTIIDFESSSIKRKTSNVSSATQAILIGTGLAKTIRRQINIPRRDKIIRLVRNYKKLKTQESFDELLSGLKL